LKLRASSNAPFAEIYPIPFEGLARDVPAKETVGSKAHNLMRLAERGLPVPPAFVLGAGLCRDYLLRGAEALEALNGILDRELDRLGRSTGKHFGDPKRPLLVSVRSGAAVSMPGMMETVLNVGLNDTTARGLVRMTGSPRLAFDCQRRLVQQFGEVVHGIPAAAFEAKLAAALASESVTDIGELGTMALKELVAAYKDAFKSAAGSEFPSDPWVQLRDSIEAVLRSWSSERAQRYRTLNDIPDDLGTATTVQVMVYGNMGPSSGSGVGFTRNPADGRNELYADYLTNAQGEDVVSGRRNVVGLDELARRAPQAYVALLGMRTLLEQEFNDMQDFEFTVEDGRLYLLQSRIGKRTPLAALRIAHDLAAVGLISTAQAVSRLRNVDLDRIETVRLQPTPDQAPLTEGIAASPGVVIGAVAFDPTRVSVLKRRGKPIILVRPHAETADMRALADAAALIAVRGARTSHAAVVARQLDKACIVGCKGVAIDASGRSGTFGNVPIREGETLSIDGASGQIYRDEIVVVKERPVELLNEVRMWEAAAERNNAALRLASPKPMARGGS
jgi:pyruvate,orthophosphate dikinase